MTLCGLVFCLTATHHPKDGRTTSGPRRTFLCCFSVFATKLCLSSNDDDEENGPPNSTHFAPPSIQSSVVSCRSFLGCLVWSWGLFGAKFLSRCLFANIQPAVLPFAIHPRPLRILYLVFHSILRHPPTTIAPPPLLHFMIIISSTIASVTTPSREAKTMGTTVFPFGLLLSSEAEF